MTTKLKKLATCCLPLILLFHSLSVQALSEQGQPENIQTSIDEIFSTLSSMENRTGTFVQTKTLTGLSFPIISHGRFAFGKGLGLYNEINKPLFQASSYSANGIIEWDEQGQQLTEISKNPAAQYVSDMLLAFFNGDKKHIREIFHIETGTKTGQPQNQQWELILTPNKKAIQEYILRININGENYIQHISVLSQNGDKTDIHFKDVVPAKSLNEFCPFFPNTTHSTCKH